MIYSAVTFGKLPIGRANPPYEVLDDSALHCLAAQDAPYRTHPLQIRYIRAALTLTSVGRSPAIIACSASESLISEDTTSLTVRDRRSARDYRAFPVYDVEVPIYFL